MTFSQYQQLQGFARKMIADKIAAIQPRAGNLFSVVGDGIAVELPKDSTAEEPAEERWVFVLYGRRRYINIGLGEYDTEWSDWDVAAWAPRTSSGLLLSGLFWQETEFFNVIPDEEEAQPFGRSVEVDFQIRTSPRPFPGGGWPSFEDAEYRSPIELTLDENIMEQGRPIETVETYKIKLRRSGHQQTFNPETPNTFYELRPTAFTRL
jgi:hypothetical protein